MASFALPEGWSGPAAGVAEAQACSGGAPALPAPPSGFTWAKPKQVGISGSVAVSVATDGFFLIDLEGNDLDVDQAAAALSVKVVDEDGAEVPGKVQLMKEVGPSWYLFSWTAAETLRVGAKLSATLDAKPYATEPVAGKYTLTVVGEPPKLVQHGLQLKDWVDVYAPAGDPVRCDALAPTRGCGQDSQVQLEVPSRLVRQLGVRPQWEHPPASTDVLWEARLDVSRQTSDAVIVDSTLTYVVEWGSADATFPTVVFPSAADSYCLGYTVKDLRSGDELSGENCGAPVEERTVESTSDVTRCLAPPTEATTEGWCRVHDSSTLPECTGAAGAPAVPSGETPHTGASPASDEGSRSSRSCQVGHATSNSPLVFFAALALVAGTRARRRSS